MNTCDEPILCHSLVESSYRRFKNIQTHLENNLSPVFHLSTNSQQFRKHFKL